MHPQAGYDVLRIFAPRVTAWRSSGRGIIQDTHTHSHKNEKQIEEGKERKVSSKVCPLGFSSPPRSHLWILPLLVFICSSTSSLGQFWQYIRLKRHALYFMAVTQLSQRCWTSFVETNGMCTLARGSPQKTQINLDGMLLQNCPEFLKLICSKHYGVALAMKRTH